MLPVLLLVLLSHGQVAGALVLAAAVLLVHGLAVGALAVLAPAAEALLQLVPPAAAVLVRVLVVLCVPHQVQLARLAAAIGACMQQAAAAALWRQPEQVARAAVG